MAPPRLPCAVGQRFGRWTVLSTDRVAGRILCLCDCGAEKRVFLYNINSGTSRSCGCLKYEMLERRNLDRRNASLEKSKYCQMPKKIEDPFTGLMTNVNQDVSSRFHRKYTVEENGCWIWNSTKAGRTRAQIRVKSKYVQASRVSYELHTGSIPDGLLALHTCDNGLCVNPNHLFLGTHKDNVMDAIAKGRFKHMENLSKIKNRKLK